MVLIPLSMTNRFLLSSFYLVNIPVKLGFDLLQYQIVIYAPILIFQFLTIFSSYFKFSYWSILKFYFDSHTKLTLECKFSLINSNSAIMLNLSAGNLLLKCVISALVDHL